MNPVNKKLPTENDMYEALKKTSTNSISRSWIQRKFGVGFKDSEKLFIQLEDAGFINGKGEIKIAQYPEDEF